MKFLIEFILENYDNIGLVGRWLQNGNGRNRSPERVLWLIFTIFDLANYNNMSSKSHLQYKNKFTGQ